MPIGQFMTLPSTPSTTAPDGSEVRILLSMTNGSMAHFTLHPGQVSKAVQHNTIQEIWYILSGTGQMWQSCEDDAQTTPLAPGTALTIPPGTVFQFRATGTEPLTAIAITMPPWPGAQEAVMAPGKWPPTD